MSRLEPIFRDVFDDDRITLTRDSSAKTIDGWDSFGHITLMFAVEKEFRVKFGLGEVAALKNVGGLADLIDAKLKAR